MVEIFKTNITAIRQANLLVKELHREFPAYRSNFDLEDCDNILRIASEATTINTGRIITFVQQQGYDLQLLPDKVPGIQLDNRI